MQGRVAGETAVGGDASFAGFLSTQVVKVFELAVARTGLRDAEAAAAGFDPVTVGLNEGTALLIIANGPRLLRPSRKAY
jgi:NADPH-dependent 2,4-dienoyl-CoA reductase/sulfur reductase-like enzyme